MSDASRVHSQSDPLDQLARECGLQLSFTDAFGRRRHARRETVVAVLAELVGLTDAGDAARVLAALHLRRRRRLVEPVVVGWAGEPVTVEVTVPELMTSLTVTVHLESGQRHRLAVPTTSRSAGPGWRRHVVRVPPRLAPPGYHRVRVTADHRRGQALLVVAPRTAPVMQAGSWGVFLPTYAARRRGDWGVGDFTALGELIDLVADAGGTTVATLPMLAQFLGERPFEPSPYSPASRLFWNELFIDVDRAPGVSESPRAMRRVQSDALRREVAALRRRRRVDYRASMAAKRSVLEAAADAAHAPGSPLRSGLETYARLRPELDAYARYRSEVDHRGKGWGSWASSARPAPAASLERGWRYHRYVQWVADEQLRAAVAHGRSRGVGLLLDLPLGVNPDSYDVYAHRELFALGARVGAPPDQLFRGGQEWGLPPFHPERLRESGYGYAIESIRRLAELAGVLRIDHVMALHRQYWIPLGHERSDGVYVQYRPEEWYAILALEADRAGCAIVGEDLGTVPPAVRPAMRAHGVSRNYVVLGALRDDPDSPLAPVPPASQASVVTHDTGPFAAFWADDDIDGYERLGNFDAATAAAERRQRVRDRRRIVQLLRRSGHVPRRTSQHDASGVLAGLHRWLAASRAAMVVVNLEDLWGERFAHNVPGTSTERPNWRGRARLTVAQARADAGVRSALAAVAAERSGGARPEA